MYTATKAGKMGMGFCNPFYLLFINASVSFGFRSVKADTDQDTHQVHISLVGIDHMGVSWITKASDVPSMVEYGTSPGSYTFSATGNSTSYSYVFYKSGSIHYVVIGPLQANTVYYYRCGGLGAEFNFKTPPSQFPITFAIVGDPGQTDWTKSTLAHIQEMEHDVFLLPGDLSYADRYQPLWDSFGKLVEPLASSRPWMVTQGNHEREIIPLIMNHPFRAYNARWRMPFEQSGSSSNLFYSFEVAGVHVIMLGSYADFGPGSDQYNWLQVDLGRVDRIRTPWLIALVHVPWYNTNSAHQGEGEDMRVAMEEMLYSAKVDMVFAGHVHAYERFSRVYNNEADPCGALHITIGGGGNREGLASMFGQNQSGLSLFREANFGHGELTIMNATHAYWTWHRNEDGESVAADQVLIQSFATSTSCAS
ncbi:purple acid phosphatase 22-like [Cryptomeria japonica]|uniref:purple acid phosphatase 22-like n=1 Tax=Cryptomeria japonica TaxID=3369 RepID=UPI0027DA616D|nr:purple acid phosphatase 22-like [Cryptomeria japonica]